jgi:putative tryptophan/tyrosine transport system substrate-binding protein
MRRRDFMAVLAGAVGYPQLAGAQQKALPVVGLLSPSPPGASAAFVAAFRQGLGDTGYVAGQIVAFELRYAEGIYDRLPALAADLVGRKVDVIATIGPPSALAAKNATSTIPIVFEVGSDPVALGLVASLARPGGNLTGGTFLSAELLPKLLQLVSEVVPQAGIIAVLVNPHNPNTERNIADVQEAVRAKTRQLTILKASTEDEIDAAFATLVQLRAGALVIAGDPFFNSGQAIKVALCPAVFDRHILSLDITRFAQSLVEGDDTRGGLVGRASTEEANHRHPFLLRAGGERPRDRGASTEDQEFAPVHSITSSAWARRVCGTVRPSALAVFRLMTDLNHCPFQHD